jgi:hypothetical protein
VGLSPSQLSAISRLFSPAVFREMAAKGKSSLLIRLLKESCLLDTDPHLARVSDVFEAAFALLRSGECRDEYIYMAALTHKVLLGTHSLQTASMLHEFRVGQCKADLVILNGTATVYEIKSERDSLSRLEKQIETYKKVFASVYVIAGQNHVDAVVASMSKDVGVMCLSKRHQITTVREATNKPGRISPETIFEAVRTTEAKQILTYLGVSIPNVPNTVLHSELRKRFVRLRPQDVHAAMVQTLKCTRNLKPLSELIDNLPPSLQPAALSIPVKKAAHQRVIKAVSTRLTEAMEWA